MFVLKPNNDIQHLLQITKSDSGIAGPEFALAHIRLGWILAEHMDFNPSDTTVVAILRGGMFFAQGIYFRLGCKFQIYDPKTQLFQRPDTSNVILVDSVISTGKTIRSILEPDMVVACCVINEKAVADFADQLYTARISKNFFVGSNVQKQSGTVGPDTTMRLFNLV